MARKRDYSVDTRVSHAEREAPSLDPPDATFLSPADRALETAEPVMTVFKSVFGDEFTRPVIVVDLFRENPGYTANSIKAKDFGPYTWLRGAFSDRGGVNYHNADYELYALTSKEKLALQVEQDLADARWKLLTRLAAAKNASTGQGKLGSETAQNPGKGLTHRENCLLGLWPQQSFPSLPQEHDQP